MINKRNVRDGKDGIQWAVHDAKGKRITGLWVRVPDKQLHSETPRGVWAVFGGDGNRERGLWYRYPHGPFYAQITDKTPTGRTRCVKVPLEATTLAKAREALHRLAIKSRDNELPVLGRTPPFNDYADEYSVALDQSGKRPGTIVTERGHLKFWKRHFGNTPVGRVIYWMIRDGLDKLDKLGRSPRTINLALTTLNNLMNRAVGDGWLKVLPTAGHQKLWRSVDTAKRPLFATADLEALCAAALRVSKNGQQFADFMQLMCYCGGRMTETLRLRWSDVDWDNEQLTIGSDGYTKGKRFRAVDFNPKLRGHLRDMHQRRLSDEWLFVSAQRGREGQAARSFRETLMLAREAAGLGCERKERTGFAASFHDGRHHFISYCVMSGIDYMTTAQWVDHKDGGILISQTYGHLSNEHLKRSAQKVTFGPQIIERGNIAA
jgi:integrase